MFSWFPLVTVVLLQPALADLGAVDSGETTSLSRSKAELQPSRLPTETRLARRRCMGPYYYAFSPMTLADNRYQIRANGVKVWIDKTDAVDLKSARQKFMQLTAASPDDPSLWARLSARLGT